MKKKISFILLTLFLMLGLSFPVLAEPSSQSVSYYKGATQVKETQSVEVLASTGEGTVTQMTVSDGSNNWYSVNGETSLSNALITGSSESPATLNLILNSSLSLSSTATTITVPDNVTLNIYGGNSPIAGSIIGSGTALTFVTSDTSSTVNFYSGTIGSSTPETGPVSLTGESGTYDIYGGIIFVNQTGSASTEATINLGKKIETSDDSPAAIVISDGTAIPSSPGTESRGIIVTESGSTCSGTVYGATTLPASLTIVDGAGESNLTVTNLTLKGLTFDTASKGTLSVSGYGSEESLVSSTTLTVESGSVEIGTNCGLNIGNPIQLGDGNSGVAASLNVQEGATLSTSGSSTAGAIKVIENGLFDLGGTLTNGGTVTVAGSTSNEKSHSPGLDIEGDSATLTNQGEGAAINIGGGDGAAGSLSLGSESDTPTIDNQSTINIGGSGSGGANLIVNSGTLTNNTTGTGTIAIKDNGTLDIRGGTIENKASANITVTGSAEGTTTDAVLSLNGGELENNTGTISVAQFGSFEYNTGTLTNAGSANINVKGTTGGPATFTSSASFNNLGNITVGGSGGNAEDKWVIANGTVTNSTTGSITVGASSATPVGTISITDGNLTNSSTTGITINQSGIVSVANGTLTNSGTGKITDGGKIDIGTSGTLENSATTNGITVTGAGTPLLTTAGTVNNTGLITVDGSTAAANFNITGGTVTNSTENGVIDIKGNSTKGNLTVSGGILNNTATGGDGIKVEADGVLTSNQGGSITNSGVISDAGEITIGGTPGLTNSETTGKITVTSGILNLNSAFTSENTANIEIGTSGKVNINCPAVSEEEGISFTSNTGGSLNFGYQGQITPGAVNITNAPTSGITLTAILDYGTLTPKPAPTGSSQWKQIPKASGNQYQNDSGTTVQVTLTTGKDGKLDKVVVPNIPDLSTSLGDYVSSGATWKAQGYYSEGTISGTEFTFNYPTDPAAVGNDGTDYSNIIFTIDYTPTLEMIPIGNITGVQGTTYLTNLNDTRDVIITLSDNAISTYQKLTGADQLTINNFAAGVYANGKDSPESGVTVAVQSIIGNELTLTINAKDYKFFADSTNEPSSIILDNLYVVVGGEDPIKSFIKAEDGGNNYQLGGSIPKPEENTTYNLNNVVLGPVYATLTQNGKNLTVPNNKNIIFTEKITYYNLYQLGYSGTNFNSFTPAIGTTTNVGGSPVKLVANTEVSTATDPFTVTSNQVTPSAGSNQTVVTYTFTVSGDETNDDDTYYIVPAYTTSSDGKVSAEALPAGITAPNVNQQQVNLVKELTNTGNLNEAGMSYGTDNFTLSSVIYGGGVTNPFGQTGVGDGVKTPYTGGITSESNLPGIYPAIQLSGGSLGENGIEISQLSGYTLTYNTTDNTLVIKDNDNILSTLAAGEYKVTLGIIQENNPTTGTNYFIPFNSTTTLTVSAPKTLSPIYIGVLPANSPMNNAGDEVTITVPITVANGLPTSWTGAQPLTETNFSLSNPLGLESSIGSWSGTVNGKGDGTILTLSLQYPGNMDLTQVGRNTNITITSSSSSEKIILPLQFFVAEDINPNQGGLSYTIPSPVTGVVLSNQTATLTYTSLASESVSPQSNISSGNINLSFSNSAPKAPFVVSSAPNGLNGTISGLNTGNNTSVYGYIATCQPQNASNIIWITDQNPVNSYSDLYINFGTNGSQSIGSANNLIPAQGSYQDGMTLGYVIVNNNGQIVQTPNSKSYNPNLPFVIGTIGISGTDLTVPVTVSDPYQFTPEDYQRITEAGYQIFFYASYESTPSVATLQSSFNSLTKTTSTEDVTIYNQGTTPLLGRDLIVAPTPTQYYAVAYWNSTDTPVSLVMTISNPADTGIPAGTDNKYTADVTGTNKDKINVSDKNLNFTEASLDQTITIQVTGDDFNTTADNNQNTAEVAITGDGQSNFGPVAIVNVLVKPTDKINMVYNVGETKTLTATQSNIPGLVAKSDGTLPITIASDNGVITPALTPYQYNTETWASDIAGTNVTANILYSVDTTNQAYVLGLTTGAKVTATQTNSANNGNFTVAGTIATITIIPRATMPVNYVGVLLGDGPSGGNTPTSFIINPNPTGLNGTIGNAITLTSTASVVYQGSEKITPSISEPIQSVNVSDISNNGVKITISPNVNTESDLGRYNIIIVNSGAESGFNPSDEVAQIIIPVVLFDAEQSSLATSDSTTSISYPDLFNFKATNTLPEAVTGLTYIDQTGSTASGITASYTAGTSTAPDLTFTSKTATGSSLYAYVTGGDSNSNDYSKGGTSLTVNPITNLTEPANLYGYVAELSIITPIDVMVAPPTDEDIQELEEAGVDLGSISIVNTKAATVTCTKGTVLSGSVNEFDDYSGTQTFSAVADPGYTFLYWMVWENVPEDTFNAYYNQISQSTPATQAVSTRATIPLGAPTIVDPNDSINLSMDDYTIIKTMTVNDNLIATINLATLEMGTDTNAYGSISLVSGAASSKINMTNGYGTLSVPKGSTFTLSSSNPSLLGYSFNHYLGNQVTVTNSGITQTSFTVQADATNPSIIAYYLSTQQVGATYQVILDYDGVSQAALTYNKNSVNRGVTQTYDPSEGVGTITVSTSVEGAQFNNWTASPNVVKFGNPKDPNTTFSINGTVSGTITITANYTTSSSSSPTPVPGPDSGSGGTGAPTVRVTTLSSPANGGTTNYAGGKDVIQGANVTVTATSSEGFTFSGWYNGNTLVSKDNPYTFKANSNVTYTAHFEPITPLKPAVTLSPSSVTLDKVGDTEDVTVTINPNTGQTVQVESSNPKVATATYDKATGKITVEAVGEGSCTITVTVGDTVVTLPVTVGETPSSGLTDIEVTPDPVYLTPVVQDGFINEQTLTLTSVPEGIDLSGATVTIEPTSVATIAQNEDGQWIVTAKSDGEATITITMDDVTVKVPVIVSSKQIVASNGVYAIGNTPDYFDVIANNLIGNPAMGLEDEPVVRASVFCWSKADQSDMNAKEAESLGNGDFSLADVPVNNTPVNNYFIFADNIKIAVYASFDQNSNGYNIANITYDWMNDETVTDDQTVSFISYGQNIGFNLPTVLAGPDTAFGNDLYSGSYGIHRQLEGVRISSGIEGLGVSTQVHAEDIGWMNPVGDGVYAGTMHENRQIESIYLTLTGEQAPNYTIQYRVHQENLGWSSWVSEGVECGVTHQHLQLEAIQVRIVPAGTPLPTV